MKSRTTVYVLILIFLCVTSFLLYKTTVRLKERKEVAQNIQRLPALTLHTLDSATFSTQELTPLLPTIIIFFNSNCEHCQYEAQAIRQRVEAFKSANLLLISWEALSPIKAFAKNYQLNNYSNIYFAHLPIEKVQQTFGSVFVPHIFIYDKHQRLVKQFKGETKVEAIIKYLN